MTRSKVFPAALGVGFAMLAFAAVPTWGQSAKAATAAKQADPRATRLCLTDSCRSPEDRALLEKAMATNWNGEASPGLTLEQTKRRVIYIQKLMTLPLARRNPADERAFLGAAAYKDYRTLSEKVIRPPVYVEDSPDGPH